MPWGGGVRDTLVLPLWMNIDQTLQSPRNEMTDGIKIDVDGPIATITLNRPERLNAIDLVAWRALGDAAARLGQDPSVRCVVLRGAGHRAFSSGADIKDFEAHRFDSRSAAEYAEVFEGALLKIEEMPQPTISMIQGVCVGGGLELAAATDIRIAAEGSRFGVPVAKIGIVAGWNELRRMIAVAGQAGVSYLVLSGRIIGHDEALRIGLVTAVVSPEDLQSEVYGLAKEIAAGAPISHADHKTMIRRIAAEPGIETLTAQERALQFRVFDTDDFNEGRRAFVAKRAPAFKGR